MNDRADDSANFLLATRHRPGARIIPAALLVLLSAAKLRAQQSASTPSDDHAMVQQLLQRVAELEAQVKQLKARQPEPSAQPDTRAEVGTSELAPASSDQSASQRRAQTLRAPPRLAPRT